MRLPNGYGSISKMSGNRRNKWRVNAPTVYELDENNKAVAKRINLGYCKTRKEALELLASYHKSKGRFLNTYTLSDAYNKMLSDKKDILSVNSLNTYNCYYIKLTPLHKTKITDITKADIELILSTINSSNYKKNFLNFINTLLLPYKKNNIIDTMPTVDIYITKDKPTTNKLISIECIKSLWDNYNTISLYTLIMLYTGMRINELINMRSEDVYLSDRYMVGGSKTKAGKNRIIPICEKIYPVIKDFHDNGNPTLINYTVSHFKLLKDIKSNFTSLGYTHTSHHCRHTFISMLSELNVPLVVIQKIVGHTSNNITEDIYTHKSASELLKYVNKLNDLC